ncbi:MAG TPA: magnesium transporter CorA family protein [Chlamydiales bacterium]|nr:magnesium transporter CorA family protein [Chlamydiales bacterium]
MLEIYFKALRDPEFKKIDQFQPGSWINVEDASIVDLDKIMEITKIDFADLKDSLDKYEIPRVEIQGENILIFTRHPAEYEAGLYTLTLTILITPQYFITISPNMSQVIHTIRKGGLKIASNQRSKLLFHILLRITQEYNNKIKTVRASVLEQEKQISGVDSESIVTLTKSEEILNQYLTSLVPTRNLLGAIASGRFIHLYEKDIDILQDLMIAIQQSEDLCDVNIKSIKSLRDSYQIIFTNDLNKTIKRLTAIMIIFTIPMVIASLYGMNVSLPLSKNPFAFIIILNIILVAMFSFVILFLKKKWL